MLQPLRSTEDHALARDLLRASFKLRDGFNIVRNPFSFQRDRDEAGTPLSAEARHEERLKLYDERLREAGTRRTDLEVKITEAEAIWDEPVRDWFMPIIRLHAELASSVSTMLEAESPRMTPQALANDRALFDEARRVSSSRSFPNPDEFDTQVANALDTIRDHLRPRLISQ